MRRPLTVVADCTMPLHLNAGRPEIRTITVIGLVVEHGFLRLIEERTIRRWGMSV